MSDAAAGSGNGGGADHQIVTVNLRELRRQATGLTDVVPVPPVRAANTAPCLVQIAPMNSAVGCRHLLADSVLVGRDERCAILCPDNSVSRLHAKIEHRGDGRYTVMDLGSSNGTFVNDTPVPTSAALKNGDYLRVGNTLFRFLVGGNVEADYHLELQQLALLDPLTGVHNRRSVTDLLQREVDRANRYARPLALVMFDIDHFKKINDAFGHAGGDAALRSLVERIRARLQPGEVLGRYGGEEFVLILPEAGLGDAQRRAEAVREAVAERPFEIEGRTHPITVSAGVGVLRSGTVTPTDLLAQADGQLYEAKHSGRNCVRPALA
jgi:diguanylate cyclase (GGDEF)-like protein